MSSWILRVLLLQLVLFGGSSIVAQTDQDCLQDFKDSVDDPTGSLAGWVFSNASGINVCDLVGVICLHQNGDVYTLNLQAFSLGGLFPSGLSKCLFLTGLDLSHNNFTGPISPTICTDVPYLVTLTLNDNGFTGGIPYNIRNCTYLNFLSLQDNKLTGPIPASIGDLPRLAKFNVSDNNLKGQIPPAVGSKFNDTTSYAHNPRLCGFPVNNRTGC